MSPKTAASAPKIVPPSPRTEPTPTSANVAPISPKISPETSPKTCNESNFSIANLESPRARSFHPRWPQCIAVGPTESMGSEWDGEYFEVLVELEPQSMDYFGHR